MATGGDRLSDRLDPAGVRDRIEDRLDAGLDPSTVRSRLDGFYARYFLPPNVTEDEVEAEEAEASGGADQEPFDFAAWLEEGSGSGPRKPPAEPRVVTGATTPTVEVDPEEFGSFEFAEWLADGEEFDPIDVLGRDADEPREDVPLEPESTEGSLLEPTVEIHPVKAATIALFLAVVALVALTVAGLLPALGPTGLAG